MKILDPRSVNLPARAVVAVLLGLVVAALGVWAQNAALVGVNYDDAIYALLSRALVRGEGYVLTHVPGGAPGVKYPPVYPLSLVPFWALAGGQAAALSGMKLANGIYLGIAAATFVLLLIDTDVLPPLPTAAIGLVGFGAASMMLVVSGVLSEPLYLALLFLTLWATDSVGRGSGPGRFIVVGLLAGLVVLTRMVGLTLLVAVVVALWWRAGRRPAFIALGVAALLVLPWAAFTLWAAPRVHELLVPRYGSYAQLYFANLAGSPSMALEIARVNLGAILQTLGGKLVGGGPLVQSVAGAVLIGLAVLGSRRAFARAPATALYPWLYLSLVTVWSFPPFRFTFILFPLLLALAVVAFLTLARAAGAWGSHADRGTARGRPLRVALLVAGAVLLGYLGYREARALSNRVWDGAQLRKSAVGAELIGWLNANAEADAVVAYEFDPMVALHTGLAAVPNNYEPVHVWYGGRPAQPETLARLFRDMEVDYLALRRDVAAVAAPIDALLGRYPRALRPVHVTSGGAIVFVLRPEALE